MSTSWSERSFEDDDENTTPPIPDSWKNKRKPLTNIQNGTIQFEPFTIVESILEFSQ